MQRKNQQRKAEAGAELVGILTAISLVSARMARNITLLKRCQPQERSESKNAKGAVSPNAN